MSRRSEAGARPAVVLLGLREHGFLVARCLGREGVRVVVLDDLPRDHLSASRYVERVPVEDLADEGAVLRTLERLERDLPAGAVMVPTRDQTALLLSRLRERLPPSYRYALPPHDVVAALLDKRGIRDRAEAVGVPIPGTAELAAEDAPQRVLERLRPPYLAKPFQRAGSPLLGFDYTVHRLPTADDLTRFHARLPAGTSVLVQEWIPGPDSGLHFVLYYFGADGTPKVWFTGRKVRQFMPHTGSACHAEPFADPAALELGNRFFAGLGYRGFGAIEFKVHGETGAHYLIEPTVGRTEHLFALAAANGVNLPYLGYLDIIGAPLPAWRQSGRAVKYVHWRKDLRAARAYARAGELSWAGWLRTLPGRYMSGLTALDDPAPLLHRLARLPGALLGTRGR